MTTKNQQIVELKEKIIKTYNMEVLSLYKLGSTECYEHLPVDVVLYKTMAYWLKPVLIMAIMAVKQNLMKTHSFYIYNYKLSHQNSFANNILNPPCHHYCNIYRISLHLIIQINWL